MESTAPHSAGLPGPHPEPPVDLPERHLPLRSVDVSTSFVRICSLNRDPLALSRSGTGRFDAPNGEYGVLYIGADVHCAFIETFGRDLNYRLVARTELEARALAEIHPRYPLRLVDLSGPGLAALGADGRLCTGDYALAQRWSLALWRHPDQPDGLLWRSRFDPSRTCVAILQRTGALAMAVTTTPLGSLTHPDHAALLAQLLDHYQFGFMDSG